MRSSAAWRASRRTMRALVTASFDPAARTRLERAMEVVHEDWRERGHIYFDGPAFIRRIGEVGADVLIVEADLVAALESRHLFAAAVDVTEIEPLPITSRLWQLPNVIITPHVGGQSRLRIDQMTDFFCENLRRYLAGRSLNNLVDKQLGFPIRRAGFE